MKRTMSMALLAGLIATAATAAEVSSENVVGYNQVTLTNGLNLVGVSWQGVGSDKVISLSELIDTSNLTSYSADGTTPGDSIDLWDLENSVWGAKLYYIDQPGVGPQYADTWMTADFTPTNAVVQTGVGFWVRLKSTSAQVTLAGEVPSTDTTVSFLEGLNLTANPFPYTRTWADITGANLTSYSADGTTPGDSIDTWDAAAADWGQKLYYIDQPTVGAQYADTWMTADFTPVTLSFEANEGFWFRAVGSSPSLTFSAIPLNVD